MNANSIVEIHLVQNGFEDLKGFEGLYKINQNGEIWNCKYDRIQSQSEKSGKYYVNLTKDKKVSKYSIDKLLKIQNGELELNIEPFDLTNFEDLKHYEGLYKINQNGEVWSCCYNKIMKPQESEDGYLWLNLKRSDGKHKCRIHRLLAIQYIENPDNLPEIDHIDRNRQNNSLSNLRWVDKKTQNNNKSTNISNLTEEEKEQRVIEIREYKRVWSEKDRREKGIQPKITFETEEERKEHERIRRTTNYKKLTASLTEEEKEERRAKQREQNKKNIEKMTPEELEVFRNKAKERARKQREKINNDADKREELREYKRIKGNEYYQKNKYFQEIK